MRKYKTDWTLKAVGIFGILTFLMSLFAENFSSALRGLVLACVGYGSIILIDYFFTYLKIDETKRKITALSFLFSQNRVKIDLITHITKEPHPIFKDWSWAIFVHYTDDAGKKKHFEIWPSFSPETMGKFLADLKHLKPNIQFDDGCKEWVIKYGKV